MQSFMLSMNIASNGEVGDPDALLALRRRVRDRPCDARAALAYHRQLWQLSGFDTYQFTLSRRGGGLVAFDVRVRVVAGQVVSAHQLDAAATPMNDGAIGTVEDYFRAIEAALYRGRGSARVQYHSLYGYPLSFSLSDGVTGRLEHRQLA